MKPENQKPEKRPVPWFGCVIAFHAAATVFVLVFLLMNLPEGRELSGSWKILTSSVVESLSVTAGMMLKAVKEFLPVFLIGMAIVFLADRIGKTRT